jgi:hypothetical protein
MRFFSFFILLLTATVSYGQYYETFDAPVLSNGNILMFPFSGGFDAPQFSQSDINNDGLDDLFVFDRNGAVSTVFLRTDNNGFSYNKELNKILPKNIEGFATLKDFNDDGIDDLFTSSAGLGAAGIALYQASGTPDNYTFRLRRMGRREGDAEIIWNRLPFGQVYCASTDIPAISDVDKDGDLDILTFDEAGNYVYFCKNNQVEKDLPKDTMDFEIADFCFGKFLESGLSQTIILSDDPGLCADNFNEEEDETIEKSGGAHAGSTVMAFDPDMDEDLDLLLGDLTYEGLVFLENGGASEAAFMTSVDYSFPSYDTPVQMPVFLGAFSVDVNNDGLEDLLVAPNAQSSIQNTNNIWYYRNTGQDKALYSLEQQDFLIEECLDYGSYSVPVYTDYNADGLQDIIIAASGPFNGISSEMRLVLLENTGSPKQASFEIVDEDYLDFSAFSSTSSNPAPCLGDLDGDGDQDMLIGDESGKLYYFENTAGPGNTFEFANPVYNWMNISSGQRIRPALFDYNKDGLLDLIIGERNTNGYNDPQTGDFYTGNLNYYQNQGTEENPLFDPEVTNAPNHPALGRINVSFSVSASARGGASPFFYSLDGKDYLFVGSIGGRISQYEIMSEDPNEPAVLIDDRLGGLVEGFWTAPALEDIDTDGQLEILIGNSRGGVSFFKTEIFTSNTRDFASGATGINIYPNPASDIVYLESDKALQRIVLSDANGKIMRIWHDTDQIRTAQFASGIYYLNITDAAGNKAVKKLSIVNF